MQRRYRSCFLLACRTEGISQNEKTKTQCDGNIDVRIVFSSPCHCFRTSKTTVAKQSCIVFFSNRIAKKSLLVSNFCCHCYKKSVRIEFYHPANHLPTTMMMKFRFLDPVLGRKYDSDGMATALSTMVDFEENPRTVFVPSNIIQDLRKALLTLMTFDCTEAFERREVLPKIVANASFFAEQMTVTGDEANVRNYNIPNRSANRFEKLRTSDDVRRMLEGFYKGYDLKIWIQTSSYSKLCRESTSSSKHIVTPMPDNENYDPNKWQTVKKRPIKRSLPLLPSKPKSSSLKAITKAGNVKCRRPKLSDKPMEDHSSEIQKKERIPSPKRDKRTMAFYSGSAISFSPISILAFSYSSFGHDILNIPPSSDVGEISSDSTVATASSTSISSGSCSSNADVSLEINEDPNTHDIETRRLLALAGCTGYGEFDGGDHGNDDFLSRILHSDIPYHGTTRNHLLPSFFETQTSLSSVTSSRLNANGAISSSVSSVISESSFESSSVASSVTKLSSYVSSPRRRRKDAIYDESSSLLQYSELEMTIVLESVLDHILLPEYGVAFCDGITTQVEIPKNSCHIPQYPCPTPKKLLAMDWNHWAPSHCDYTT
mmetsp:Transcript_215/g.490  ORF Transcript_215/g.490 Transcript_215/m.490 type:complete len:601 (-) Transcript_215:72-1874(-)